MALLALPFSGAAVTAILNTGFSVAVVSQPIMSFFAAAGLMRIVIVKSVTTKIVL